MLRYEFKYFVPNDKYRQLYDLIERFALLDPFAASKKRKEYTVRSIYFDTPDYECYHTKIEGYKHRNKVRLRGYNYGKKSSKVFLEIKRKYEGPILKNRAPFEFKAIRDLFEGNDIEDYILADSVIKKQKAHDNVMRFMYHVHSRKMRPVVLVIYERVPFLSQIPDDENNLRITFDKNLRSKAFPTLDELYTDEKVKNCLDGYFILEVKFNQYYPSWMKSIIANFGLRKEPASKYCISIDNHNQIDIYSRFNTFSYGRFFDDNSFT